jgi:5-methylcytosine-specific restriction endonuclease McrA
MSRKDPAKRTEYLRDYYEKNKEKISDRKKEHYDDKTQHAYNSISHGEILDRYKWDVWCDKIKRAAKNHPYSTEFTSDVMFEMMIKGCFYCGDIATTIDRVDSKLDHTPGNCVGSCKGCNASKGAADPSTFVRKAYYRTRRKYYDDDINIWFVHKQKPSMWHYENKAKRQGVPFDLNKEMFETILKKDCGYCNRTPSTWFGIDRVNPLLGYVIGNVVTSCYDCNLDKLDDDIDTMSLRNERIARRVDAGEIVVTDCPRVILHTGTQKSSKKVCVRGKMYANMSKATTAIKMSDGYVSKCINRGYLPDEIFEITDEFYEMYKDFDDITRSMFVGFDHFYTNM